MNIIKIFRKLNFDLKKDLKPVYLNFKDNDNKEDLNFTCRLKNRTYFYHSPHYASTAFYLFNDNNLNKQDIKRIHKRIWNQNKADLFIVPQRDQIEIHYSKTNPCHDTIKIDVIDSNQEDSELLRKISRSHFDTGLFWFTYKDALKKIQRQRDTVDVNLIESLEDLRKKLLIEYDSIISCVQTKDHIIQALIDRTLFIKFLEDRKIIDSYFYEHFFQDNRLTYKELLNRRNAPDQINKLFKKINVIFNHSLFKEPVIEPEHLTKKILDHLYNTISQTDPKSGQMFLFDFDFDIIPVEFISRIYEIFLENKQKKEGIYYTPESLAELVINSTINDNRYGSVMDPSCGSGIFLVLAFRKMLKAKEKDVKNPNIYELIKKRNKFLKSNIFGIEKNPTARRLTIFSLYLEILDKIDPKQIKELIKKNIGNKDFKLFPKNFDENIVCKNAVETNKGKKPFMNRTFDFIIGNLPWKKIEKQDEDYMYWDKYRKNFTKERQLSQCFLHKIKDWAADTSRFGFVVDSSNFYNESDKFQIFFYKTYNIEKYYELKNIKTILFKNAKEHVATVIFNNKRDPSNAIEYLSPDLNDFLETFKVILLKEEDIVLIPQIDLIEKRFKLRDFLFGNKKDLELCEKILKSDRNRSLRNLLLKDKNYNSMSGRSLAGKKIIAKKFKIEGWDNLPLKQKNEYKELFLDKPLRTGSDKALCIPYITPKCIENFIINHDKADRYLSESIHPRDREQNEKIFEGEKILYPKNGKKSKAAFTKKKLYFSTDIYVIKLKDKHYYPVIVGILNSTIVNYLFYIKNMKKPTSSFPKINKKALLDLPIPIFIETDIKVKITDLVNSICFGRYNYKEKKEKLDQLIFDLYDLDIVERDRILSFFKTDNAQESDIIEYCKTFKIAFSPYLKKGISLRFEYYLEKRSLPIGFAGVKIFFEKNKESNNNEPRICETVKYIDHNLLKYVGKQNVFSLKERIYGENLIYIIKDKKIQSWTKTKALEDASIEIKRLT